LTGKGDAKRKITAGVTSSVVVGAIYSFVVVQ